MVNNFSISFITYLSVYAVGICNCYYFYPLLLGDRTMRKRTNLPNWITLVKLPLRLVHMVLCETFVNIVLRLLIHLNSFYGLMFSIPCAPGDESWSPACRTSNFCQEQWCGWGNRWSNSRCSCIPCAPGEESWARTCRYRL